MSDPPQDDDHLTTDGRVEVLRWSLDKPPAEVAKLREWLNEEELSRAAAFVKEASARRFIVARAYLRRLLAERVDCSPAEVGFRYGPAGKPELDRPQKSTVCFNLSHTGEFALCVIDADPVGIDMERQRNLSDPEGLARRWFSQAELSRIAAAPMADRLEAFFRVWTAKESVLKLIGLGVGESLPRLETPPALSGGWATSLPANSAGLTRCWVQPLEVDSRHHASLATAERIARPSVTVVD